MLPVLWTCWSVLPIKLAKRLINRPWHSGSLPEMEQKFSSSLIFKEDIDITV